MLAIKIIFSSAGKKKGEDCCFFTFLHRKYHLFFEAAEAAIYG
jgi:hypothetical protein